MSSSNLQIKISHKLNEIQALIIQIKIDIILLGETKLNPNTPLKFPNYITYRTDNTPFAGSPANGGIALLVHQRIVNSHIILNTIIKSTSI